MKPVFVDAFFYVAFLNRLDQHHQKAMLLANQRFTRMITTRLVLAVARCQSLSVYWSKTRK
jgi:hypothetical protein